MYPEWHALVLSGIMQAITQPRFLDQVTLTPAQCDWLSHGIAHIREAASPSDYETCQNRRWDQLVHLATRTSAKVHIYSHVFRSSHRNEFVCPRAGQLNTLVEDIYTTES